MPEGLLGATPICPDPPKNPSHPSRIRERLLLSLINAAAAEPSEALDQLEPSEPALVVVPGDIEGGVREKPFGAILLRSLPIVTHSYSFAAQGNRKSTSKASVLV